MICGTNVDDRLLTDILSLTAVWAIQRHFGDDWCSINNLEARERSVVFRPFRKAELSVNETRCVRWMNAPFCDTLLGLVLPNRDRPEPEATPFSSDDDSI